jgi:hypothetical protein
MSRSQEGLSSSGVCSSKPVDGKFMFLEENHSLLEVRADDMWRVTRQAGKDDIFAIYILYPKKGHG